MDEFGLIFSLNSFIEIRVFFFSSLFLSNQAHIKCVLNWWCSFVKDHWSSFIVEDDFKFIASNGLNAVRIPVGWWIASDPTPPWPYVGGSLHALDNAFLWAQ
jgi:hypothetical protein